MTFDELRRTLDAARIGGGIGQSVSLRLHLRLIDFQGDLTDCLGTCLEWAESIFEQPVARLMAQENGDGRQISVLANHAGGQTAAVTVSGGLTAQAELQLLLVGNRGIVRLAGDEDFDGGSIPAPSLPQRWKSLIEGSLGQRAAVVATE